MLLVGWIGEAIVIDVCLQKLLQSHKNQSRVAQVFDAIPRTHLHESCQLN